MQLEICEQCKRPYLASEEFCPRCPRPEWNQESWVNLGCLVAMILPLFLIALFWILFFMGLIFR